jgi:hypothetical protein
MAEDHRDAPVTLVNETSEAYKFGALRLSLCLP